MNRISLQKAAWLDIKRPVLRPELPDSCFVRRINALREAMEKENLDCVAIYADREHYANIKYYIGFEPRFEEALAVIFRDTSIGDAILLGNECIGMAKYAKTPLRPVLCQIMSLPGQPMDSFVSMERSINDAGIHKGMRVGLIGWKLMTKRHGANPESMFCVSSFIVDALRNIVGDDMLVNATQLLIDPNRGLRLINDADEIAYMEYGSTMASDCVMNAWRDIGVGKREMEIADNMRNFGQQLSCHTMMSTGENASKGLISPGFRKIELGDAVSFSMGLEGGLSCRGAYAVHDAGEMPESVRNFERDIATPYYSAVVAWYETIGFDVTGGDMFALVQGIIPKEKFGWTLNPGHLTAYEEWLTSGIAPQSTAGFHSGMLVQMDIIPSVAPFVSPNAEDGICLADEALQADIRAKYPEMWKRFMQRRDYMRYELGVKLKNEVLPMSDLAGRYSPYLLDLERAFVAG